MQPVKLPKHICDAIDGVMEEEDDNVDYIAWNIARRDYSSDCFTVLQNYVDDDKNSFIDVVNALQYGCVPIKTKRQDLIELIELLKCNGESVTETLADAILEMFNVNGSDPVE